ncbi:MAG TPA: helix-turn-helix domain-containing protein [Candidatus Limnocylindria bacterium]|jgi:DNA-binding HxlR family transcriptional regulator|nr:helix-turn-helix domain-containing protein [Candidatus Limnocylindria bacterium]
MSHRAPPITGDCFKDACPAREVLNHVSNRWGGLVIAALLERELRYSEIRARVGGISEKMLAQTLDVLERDGLISRTSHPVIPPRVEYALTPSGRELADRLTDLFTWIGANVETFVKAQEAYDAEQVRRSP